MGWQEDHNHTETCGWTVGGGELSPAARFECCQSVA